MKKFTANGIYGEGDVWILESLEDFDEYLKLNPGTSLSPNGWYNVFKEAFAKYAGKEVHERYKVIGVEVNDAWCDVYWVLENKDDPKDIKTCLELEI